jgi:hypothetical protein
MGERWKELFDDERNLGYRLAMTGVEAEYEADVEQALGPSLAIPPIYVLRAAVRCPECGEAIHVYTLGCTAFHDAEERYPIEDFHFLRLIRSVPEGVLKLLKAKCPGYFLDREGGSDSRYLMNHCRCGARLDDDFVHGDVGAAFWPDTPEGFRRLKLSRLPVDDEIPVECSYFLGAGEYLNFGASGSW